MSTPTDPYSAMSRKSFDDEEILQDLPANKESSNDTVEGSLSLDDTDIDVKEVSVDSIFDETNTSASADSAVQKEKKPVEATQKLPSTTNTVNSSATLDQALNVTPHTASSAADLDIDYSLYTDSAASDSSAKNSTWEAAPEKIDTIPDAPKSRVKGHIGAFFGTLLLMPLTWYLLSDTSIRLFDLKNSPWATGHISIGVLFEGILALALLGFIWFLARTSSLGAFVTGLLLTALGATSFVAPGFARHVLAANVDNSIGSFNTFTGNIAHHFAQDLGSGFFLFFGFILLMTAYVSHSARRQGKQAGIQETRRKVALGQ